MKLARTLLADLRDRQILPAALLLGLLALGIPIFASIALSKTPTPTPTPVHPTPPIHLPKGVPTPAKELSALNGKAVPVVHRKGGETNPFRVSKTSSTSGSTPAPTSSSSTPHKTSSTVKPHVTTSPSVSKPSTKKTSTSTSGKHTTTTPKTSTTPPKTSTTPPKTSTTPPKTTTTPKTTTPSNTNPSVSTGTFATGPAVLMAKQAYTTTIDTIDAQGTHALKDVVRLAPLPAAESPEVIFLGVLQGGKKDVFLFTNTVQVTGGSKTGTCLPSPSDCQIIELAPGQGMKLAPTANSALIATFTFEVGSIGVKNYSSTTAADAARADVSSTGQTLLPLSGSTELSSFRFDSSLGALVYKAVSNGATGATGTTGSTGTTGTTGASGASGASGGSVEVAPTGGTESGNSLIPGVALALTPVH